MSLDGRFLFWQFDARKSAEEEVLIGLVGHQEILILRQVELALQPLLVGLRSEIGLEIFKSGCELMLGEDASDFAVGQDLKIGVSGHQFLQFGLLSLFFGCLFGWLWHRLHLEGFVVFCHLLI